MGIGEDGAVAEGLHDVIVVGAFLCVKEFLDGFGSLWFVAGFIIDNAYVLREALRRMKEALAKLQ